MFDNKFINYFHQLKTRTLYRHLSFTSVALYKFRLNLCPRKDNTQNAKNICRPCNRENRCFIAAINPNRMIDGQR